MSLPLDPIPYADIQRLGATRWTTINSRRLIWRKGRKPDGGLRRMVLYFHREELVGWESFYSSGDRLVSFHDKQEAILARANGEVVPLGAIDLPALTPDRWEIRERRESVDGRRGGFVRVVPPSGNGHGYAAEAVRPGKRDTYSQAPAKSALADDSRGREAA